MTQWTEKQDSTGPDRVASESPPESPSKGTEWIDESYRSPALKYWDGEKFVELVPGSNVPSEQEYTSGTHQVDVSDITSTVTVELKGERGESTPDASGGRGGQIMAGIDLSRYDTLTVYAGNYKSGGSGTGDGGDGGASSAIEGDGELIVAAGGGGGASYEYRHDNYQTGGGGGGPSGGSGGESEYYGQAGEDGGYWTKDRVEVKNTGTASSPNARLFIGGGGG